MGALQGTLEGNSGEPPESLVHTPVHTPVPHLHVAAGLDALACGGPEALSEGRLEVLHDAAQRTSKAGGNLQTVGGGWLVGWLVRQRV